MKAEMLLHFASKTADGKSEYFSYCVRERRSCLELFKDFEVSTQVPLDYIVQGVSRQRPREFSISSAPRLSDDSNSTLAVDLTMAVTEYETKFGRQITGLCSGWLRSLSPQGSPRVPVWLKRGTMIFPETVPLIMVGPGTGVAAFRSVIQERAIKAQ